MSTATKNADIKETESVISKHEMELLLNLAENLQSKHLRSRRFYGLFFYILLFIVLAFLGFVTILIIDIMSGGEIIDSVFAVVVWASALIVAIILSAIYFEKIRKRAIVDEGNFLSVMDMVEEAQLQFTSQMTPVEKAMFGIRLRNLDFDVSEILA